ncbi:MAG: radical SAM protein [Deltaproteobacteria bacterium]|nr:radical SAM protein [Deltaproteobacteria bacterium]
MDEIDIIFISQSDVANYNEYSKLPLERIELFKELIYPRMVYFKGEFHSHLDVYNYYLHGQFYKDANYSKRKKMLNIWNLPGFNGIHIADYLFQHNINSKIINNFDTNWDNLCSTYESCKVKPIIAISTTFHLSHSEIRRMSKQILSVFPNASILLGGAFINERYINGEHAELEATMRKNKIRYIIHSFNSEIDLKNLILSIKENNNLNNVNNLFYFESNDFINSKLYKTKEIWNNPTLSALNSLDHLNQEFINNTLQIRSSSGCPFSCAFCSYPTTAKGFHVQEIVSFKKTIQHILSTTKINKLIFIDDTFNVPKTRFIEILKILKKYQIEWFSFLRVQFIDNEIAKLMRESGCRAVYLGIESANDIILQNMNKKATKAQFLNGISFLKKYGILSIAAFIIGYPGENDSTIEEDASFIENSGIDFYTLKEFYFMKQTSIYNERKKYGLTGTEHNWNHDTMSYQLASQKKSEIFLNIKDCIFIDPDTSLWAVAYLFDQGFSFEKIKLLQKEINQIMYEQMKNNFSEDLPAYQNIKLLLTNH